ncbi:LysR family transcriptional regulator [Pseudonocardia oroxyli]|uniref:DNA-binding transcriptional regulator, LysR family n=1 Tax=Pseudonocardia oroxyli TaxID=366584 RepID=A0A1G7HRW0_PSEOR|nr:LysR substrate-binding domain-containing protein [Pseudonocardia oroxyli]SDF03200.1 DNA-binding transcriptional regulator, LysR family [Pseudonocardia oroxyli]
MELRHLRYLVAVAEEGTVTAAAARLHVAQPGVSAQLRQLERELGEPLLVRSAQGVALTEAGAAVLPFAHAALAAVEGARLAVDELKGLVRGRVVVGMAPSLAATDLPELLAEFRAAHPHVEVVLREGTSAELLSGLVGGTVDLAWVGVAEELPAGIESRAVTDQVLVAVGSAGPVELADLVRRPVMCMAAGSGPRAAFDLACARAGLRPTVAFEAGDPLLLARLAARGLGVAVLPAGAVRAAGLELEPAPIVPEMRSRILLAWRGAGPNGPAARALIARAARS